MFFYEMLLSTTKDWTRPGVILLPTVGFVIGAIFLSMSIWFDKHERYRRANLLSRQQLLQKVLSANSQRLILAILLIMLSGFSFYGCYLLSKPTIKIRGNRPGGAVFPLIAWLCFGVILGYIKPE